MFPLRSAAGGHHHLDHTLLYHRKSDRPRQQLPLRSVLIRTMLGNSNNNPFFLLTIIIRAFIPFIPSFFCCFYRTHVTYLQCSTECIAETIQIYNAYYYLFNAIKNC